MERDRTIQGQVVGCFRWYARVVAVSIDLSLRHVRSLLLANDIYYVCFRNIRKGWPNEMILYLIQSDTINV